MVNEKKLQLAGFGVLFLFVATFFSGHTEAREIQCWNLGRITAESCQHCVESIEKAQTFCEQAQVTGAQYVSYAGHPAMNGSIGGMRQAAQTAQSTHSSGALAGAAAADTCQAIKADLLAICTQSRTYYRQEKVRAKITGTETDVKAAAHNTHVVDEKMRKAIAYLDSEIAQLAATANQAIVNTGQAANVVQEVAASSGSETTATGAAAAAEGAGGDGFWTRNKDWMLGAAGGLAVGVGGCFATKACGGDNEDGSAAANSPEPKDSTTGTAPTQCENDDAYKNEACHSFLVAKCSKDPGSDLCDNFADSYCSSNTGGDSTTASDEYCLAVNKTKYCQNSDHATCPTCTTMNSNGVDACEKDPQSCQPQLSAPALKQAQAQCPTDPAYSDPDILAKLEGFGANGDYSSQTQPRGLQKQTGSEDSHGVTTFAVIGADKNGRLPAATRQADLDYPDISRRHGPSLWRKTSNTIKKYCGMGAIDNCTR